MRWKRLGELGLIGGSLVAAGTARAERCDEVADKTIGFVVGMEWAGQADRIRIIGGVEGRACVGQRGHAMVRMEFGGGSPRLIGGLRVYPGMEDQEDPAGPVRDSKLENLGLEAGPVIDMRGQMGAHLAVSYGGHSLYGAVQVFAPLTGVERQSRLTLVGGLAPWTLVESRTVDGRPLRRDGAFVRPAVRGLPAVMGGEARAVRDHFVDAAQMEYSSVWTFVRLAEELAAVGAPARLVVAALDAAEDEVRHAEMCAAAAGGAELMPLEAAPARFAARSARALEVLAAEAWAEGCLDEGAAAEEARLAAGEAQGPNRAMLATIAGDESRHAALSWEVLTWIATVAPETVDALAALPPGAESRRRPHDAALARHGVPSPEIAAAARASSSASARRKLAELQG